MIIDLPRKRYHIDKHFSDFLPTRWRQKSTGIDMEQNYVTVTLCIYARVRDQKTVLKTVLGLDTVLKRKITPSGQ